MAVSILTFIASEEEISFGIPKSVSIEANIPSTIYYTLDGTTPDTNSPIYIETIDFPTGINSITLSAFGVDSTDEAGPILTQFFAPNVSKITISRHVGSEGIVVDRANYGQDNPTGFDADGAVARFIDVDPDMMPALKSARGYLGLEEGTAIDVNVPLPEETPSLLDDNFQAFSSPEKAELFNPFAKMIVIDNRINNDVNIIPRPYGSLNNQYREFGGKRIRNSNSDASYVSGGFVRRFYDGNKNVMVSYYFDHNESRYVKNIQQLPSNMAFVYSGNFTMPLTFKWIERGKQSSY